MNRNKAVVTLMGTKINAKVIMTRDAMWGCTDNCILPDVAVSLISHAPNYMLSKVEGDRFTIVSPEIKTVIIGIILFKDDEEMETLITGVYGDAFVIKNDNYCNLDNPR